MCYKNMKTCRDYKHCSKSKVKKNTKQEQSKHGPLLKKTEVVSGAIEV